MDTRIREHAWVLIAVAAMAVSTAPPSAMAEDDGGGFGTPSFDAYLLPAGTCKPDANDICTGIKPGELPPRRDAPSESPEDGGPTQP